ncbi:MAG: LuxR C-terminal-related transcriptional regulator [Eggerthellaceae bacterium]|nr:LuxR C-terminal-related transcriptional regulator [Eggerthellaceae bacterium]
MRWKTLKPQYWGVGFVWMWVYAAYSTSAVYGDRLGSGINADSSWLASSVAFVVALFLMGLLWRKRDGRGTSRRLLVVAGLVSAAGTALSVVTVEGFAGFALSMVAGSLSGLGTGVLLVLWLAFYCRIPIAEAERSICLSGALPLLGALVFPYLSGAVGVVAAVSLPLLSALTLFLAESEAACESSSARVSQRVGGMGVQLGSFLRMMFVVAVFYFVGGCIEAMRDSSGVVFGVLGFDAVSFIGAGFGVALAIAFSRFSMSITFRELFRWLIPLIVLSLALFPWIEPAPMFLHATILNVADTAMQALSLMCFVWLVRKRVLNVYFAAGLCQGVIQLGVLMGNVAGSLVFPLVLDGRLNVFVLVLSLICLTVASQSLLPEFDSILDPGMLPAGVTAVGSEAGKSAAEMGLGVAEDPIDVRCRELASAYGLSARECEVLGYLARGRSQPYIRDKLVLSRNTVATHVKHV